MKRDRVTFSGVHIIVTLARTDPYSSRGSIVPQGFLRNRLSHDVHNNQRSQQTCYTKENRYNLTSMHDVNVTYQGTVHHVFSTIIVDIRINHVLLFNMVLDVNLY